MSYIILRGRWCHITALNINETDTKHDVTDSFYEKLERVFHKFCKHHMKILLGDFKAKVGREYILNRQLGMKVYMKSVMIMKLG
jgi:hypothetical protein